jgi:hypothetical protein
MPWRDSNPGLLVPEADAMSTAPRRARASLTYIHALNTAPWKIVAGNSIYDKMWLLIPLGTSSPFFLLLVLQIIDLYGVNAMCDPKCSHC